MFQQEKDGVYLVGGDRPLWNLQREPMNLFYANTDRSVWGQHFVDRWNLTRLEKDSCVLASTVRIEELNTDLAVQVTYTRKGNLVEKEVSFFQNNIPNLYVGFTQKVVPEKGGTLWSFDDAQQEDGCIFGKESRQAFPAAGFFWNDGSVLGVLMDTGVNNSWSRWCLRRTSGGNGVTVSCYDPVLMEAAGKQTELLLRAGQYFPVYDVAPDNVTENTARFLARKGYSYSLEFDCGDCPCSVSATWQDGEPGRMVWKEQGRQVLELPVCEENGIWEITWEKGKAACKGLFEKCPEYRPWHRLAQGDTRTYRYFFFVDQFEPSLRNLRKYSQLYLAQALGFSGSAGEKILYADFRMLNWLAEPEGEEPLCVPSIDYFEMYFRDVFWSVHGVEDPDLQLGIFRRIEKTMDARGWVDNIITPYYGSEEKTDNELNYLYVIWSYWNQKQLGVATDLEKVEKVVSLVLNRYDPKREGKIFVNNPQSLMDVMWQEKPCAFAVSQGYFCLTMKIAFALGIAGVDQAYLERVQEGYRSYYRIGSSGKKYLQTFPGNKLGERGEDLEIISCLDLEPEFLSLYLLGESILGEKIVRDTLDQIPVFCDCRMPIVSCIDGSFFTRERNPFNGGLYWEGGCYANGGSYLRPQYIALAVGKYHGWEKADALMKARMRAEFESDPDFPVSHEYLHALGNPQKNSDHKVFAWNVFVNEVNRWIRREIDPEFQVGEEIV